MYVFSKKYVPISGFSKEFFKNYEDLSSDSKIVVKQTRRKQIFALKSDNGFCLKQKFNFVEKSDSIESSQNEKQFVKNVKNGFLEKENKLISSDTDHNSSTECNELNSGKSILTKVPVWIFHSKGNISKASDTKITENQTEPTIEADKPKMDACDETIEKNSKITSESEESENIHKLTDDNTISDVLDIEHKDVTIEQTKSDSNTSKVNLPDFKAFIEGSEDPINLIDLTIESELDSSNSDSDFNSRKKVKRKFSTENKIDIKNYSAEKMDTKEDDKCIEIIPHKRTCPVKTPVNIINPVFPSSLSNGNLKQVPMSILRESSKVSKITKISIKNNAKNLKTYSVNKLSCQIKNDNHLRSIDYGKSIQNVDLQNIDLIPPETQNDTDSESQDSDIVMIPSSEIDDCLHKNPMMQFNNRNDLKSNCLLLANSLNNQEFKFVAKGNILNFCQTTDLKSIVPSDEIKPVTDSIKGINRL